MKVIKLYATLFIFLSLCGCGSFGQHQSEATASIASEAQRDKISSANNPDKAKPAHPKTVSAAKITHASGAAKKPTALTPNKSKMKKQPPIENDSSKIIVGEAEYAKIVPGDIKLKARMDTGAKSTSISALNISEFERDGEKWVKFDLLNTDGTLIPVSARLIGKTLIKQHGSKAIKRPEIMASIIIGDVEQHIKVNLADRSRYEYPVLIGRNYLEGVFIVDTSRKFTQGFPKK